MLRANHCKSSVWMAPWSAHKQYPLNDEFSGSYWQLVIFLFTILDNFKVIVLDSSQRKIKGMSLTNITLRVCHLQYKIKSMSLTNVLATYNLWWSVNHYLEVIQNSLRRMEVNKFAGDIQIWTNWKGCSIHVWQPFWENILYSITYLKCPNKWINTLNNTYYALQAPCTANLWNLYSVDM